MRKRRLPIPVGRKNHKESGESNEADVQMCRS
jgi:hypothetical protein